MENSSSQEPQAQRVLVFHGFTGELFDRLVRGVRALLPEDMQPVCVASNPVYWEKTLEALVLQVLASGQETLREDPMVEPQELVLYIHGFPRDVLFNLVNGLKLLLPDRKAVAFCTSTKNNLGFKLKDLVKEVRMDHAYMTGQGPKPPENP